MADEMKELSVYMPGSQVLLDGRVTATVIAVNIMIGNIVRYTCVWWREDDRKEEVIEDLEVQPDGDKAREMRVKPIL